MTKSADISRKVGKICFPPFTPSVADIKWSMVETTTGAYNRLLLLVSRNTVLKRSSGTALSYTISMPSLRERADAEPDVSASASLPTVCPSWRCSCRKRTAAEPINTANSVLSSLSLSRYSSPVCKVRVRKPNARL